MLNGLFRHSSIPALQETVAFAQARQGVLAGNLANIHTPGYRTRDLSVESFQEALKKQIEVEREGDITSPGHPISPRQEALHKVKASMNNIVYHDGTNLDVEKQVVEASKNQYLHNLAITIMTSQFQQLETAISERV
jgi:flagellar basal-body rod protein FlgB